MCCGAQHEFEIYKLNRVFLFVRYIIDEEGILRHHKNENGFHIILRDFCLH